MRKVITMRKAWDAFLFCNELDLLEARLTELDSAVYRHVLVEAPVTFQGDPKPLWYAENKERFLGVAGQDHPRRRGPPRRHRVGP